MFIPAGAFFFIGIASSIGAVRVGFLSKKKDGKKDWEAITLISLGFTAILVLILVVSIVKLIL